jgi:acyl carrier protein
MPIERQPQEEVMRPHEPNAEAAVRATVAQFIGRDLRQVSETADFAEDLGMDSLDRLELMAAIETEFDVELSDEELSSVSNMRELIRALVAAGTGRLQ